MDLLTHSLGSALILELCRPAPAAGQGPQAPRGWLLSTCLVGMLPDLDGVTYLVSTAAYLDHHRGLTHSLLVALVMAPLLVWLRRRLFPGPEGSGLGRAWVLALLLHGLMDWTTPFGTGLLEPLHPGRFSLRWFYIFDPVLFGLLLLAVIRVRRGAGRGVLVALGLYTAGAGLLTMAGDALAARTHPGGRCVPMFLAPHHRLLAQRQGASATQAVLDPIQGVVLGTRRLPIPAAVLDLEAQAFRTPGGRSYQGWSRAPYPILAPDRDRLQVVDLRYPPLAGRRIFVLHAAVDPAAGALLPATVGLSNHIPVGASLLAPFGEGAAGLPEVAP